MKFQTMMIIYIYIYIYTNYYLYIIERNNTSQRLTQTRIRYIERRIQLIRSEKQGDCSQRTRQKKKKFFRGASYVFMIKNSGI